jgi:hypothetical protein
MGTRSNDDGAGSTKDVGGVCGVLSAVAKGKQFSSKTTCRDIMILLVSRAKH